MLTPFPLPSMIASSLSSLVTQPFLLLAMAYLMGSRHSFHHVSSDWTAQRRPGSPFLWEAKGQTALTTSYVFLPENSEVTVVMNLLTLSGFWTSSRAWVSGLVSVSSPLLSVV